MLMGETRSFRLLLAEGSVYGIVWKTASTSQPPLYLLDQGDLSEGLCETSEKNETYSG